MAAALIGFYLFVFYTLDRRAAALAGVTYADGAALDAIKRVKLRACLQHRTDRGLGPALP